MPKSSATSRESNPTKSNVDKPYDWEHYETGFKPSKAYSDQEEVIFRMFGGLLLTGNPSAAGPAAAGPAVKLAAGPPRSILEVGPGLGRITRLALFAFPEADYSAADVALAPLAEAERLAGGLVDSFFGPIQAPDFYQRNKRYRTIPGGKHPTYDLVLAVEVLMHVPPEELDQAVANLVMVTAPGGTIITCDWTEPLPRRTDGSEPPIRVQNYRHNYLAAFIGGRDVAVAESQKVGYQTIFRMKP